MKKPLVTIRFHGEEPAGPIVRSAARLAAPLLGSDAEVPSGPARPVLPAVYRFAQRLGAPVKLSLTCERLARAASDPAERKALADGCSRGRLLIAPFPGFSADPRRLAPFEAADEMRLDVDLWRRLLLAPPFARPERDAPIRVFHPGRAQSFLGQSGSFELLVPLESLEAMDEPRAFLDGWADDLGRSRNARVAQPSPDPGYGASVVRDVLSGARIEPNWPADDALDAPAWLDAVDALRSALPPAAATRTLADHLDAIVGASFDVTALDAPLRRGILLRSVHRIAPEHVRARAERAREALFVLTALLADLLDDAEAAGAFAGEVSQQLARGVFELAGRSAPDPLPDRLETLAPVVAGCLAAAGASRPGS